MILALSMLQTKVRNLEPGDEPHFLGRSHLVQLGQDLTGVRGEGHQHREVGQGH